MPTLSDSPAQASRNHIYTKQEIDQIPEAIISDTPLDEADFDEAEVVDAEDIGTVYLISGESAAPLTPDSEGYEMVVLEVDGNDSEGLIAPNDDSQQSANPTSYCDYDEYGTSTASDEVYGIEGEMDPGLL